MPVLRAEIISFSPRALSLVGRLQKQTRFSCAFSHVRIELLAGQVLARVRLTSSTGEDIYSHRFSQLYNRLRLINTPAVLLCVACASSWTPTLNSAVRRMSCLFYLGVEVLSASACSLGSNLLTASSYFLSSFNTIRCRFLPG